MSSSNRFVRIATSLPVRILVSVGLLAIVAVSIDWDTVVEGLEDAKWWLFAFSVVVFFAGFVVAGLRWRVLLRAADVPASLFESIRAYLVGMFANNLLPTGYGGDAVRAWVVAPSGKPLARSVTSVLVDRISALLCLLLLAWVAVVFKADELPGGIVLLLAVSTGLMGVAGVAGLFIARRRGLGRFLPDTVRPWTGEVANVIRAYEADRRMLAEVLAIGIVYQALVLVAFWLIGESLGLDLDPAILAVVVPPVLLAALLPISLAGFGVREGAFVVLLGEFGVSAGDATLLSVLSVVGVTIASLPGAVAIAGGTASIKRQDAGEPAG